MISRCHFFGMVEGSAGSASILDTPWWQFADDSNALGMSGGIAAMAVGLTDRCISPNDNGACASVSELDKVSSLSSGKVELAG